MRFWLFSAQSNSKYVEHFTYIVEHLWQKLEGDEKFPCVGKCASVSVHTLVEFVKWNLLSGLLESNVKHISLFASGTALQSSQYLLMSGN